MGILKNLSKAKDSTKEIIVEKGGAAANVAAKVGSQVADGAAAMVAKAQDAQRERRLNAYNPVFPDDFKSPDYDLPNLIIVVDGDSRKGVDVCEGAIGWLEKSKGTEVLYLYEDAIGFSGLNFYPYAECDAAYSIDSFNRNRFINLDNYFDVMQQEKMTELRNIAYSLGATECYLEAKEEISSSSSGEYAGNIKAYGQNVSASYETSQNTQQARSVLFSQKFEGSSNPVVPMLNWFKNDKELNSLIEMRCSGVNTIKEYDIRIDTSSFSAMSASRAAKIDAVLKGTSVKSSISCSNKAEKELKRTLVFKVVFS